MKPDIDTVLFDLGKVLLDWDPRYFYRTRFGGDEPAMERFLAEVVPSSWVLETDAGKPMLRGEIEGTAAIVSSLKTRGRRLFALTNFSTETWPRALQRCPSLALFEDAIVSGEHHLVKPDPRIYELAIARCRLDPARTVFVDDLQVNVTAARESGLHALHFTGPDQLRMDLSGLSLL